MIYFDTSALAKKYLKKEKGRNKVIELLESNPQHLVSSALTNLEITSALTRRQREISGFDKAIQSFFDDWESFIVWTIDDPLIGSAATLIRTHRLKAADAPTSDSLLYGVPSSRTITLKLPIGAFLISLIFPIGALPGLQAVTSLMGQGDDAKYDGDR